MHFMSDDYAMKNNRSPELNIEIIPFKELSDRLIDYVRRSNDREFGDDSMIYDHPEWYAIGFLEDEPVTHTAILRRTISIDGTPIGIAGISFIVTEPDFRGRGYARLGTDRAVLFVSEQLALPHCLLTCKPRLESLYTGWGWHTAPGPTVFMQPTGPRDCGGLTMVYQCTEKAWPEGKIDLCGLPW
jgi:hypothetical protein